MTTSTTQVVVVQMELPTMNSFIQNTPLIDINKLSIRHDNYEEYANLTGYYGENLLD